MLYYGDSALNSNLQYQKPWFVKRSETLIKTELRSFVCERRLPGPVALNPLHDIAVVAQRDLVLMLLLERLGSGCE